jgi:hypothetical protein
MDDALLYADARLRFERLGRRHRSADRHPTTATNSRERDHRKFNRRGHAEKRSQLQRTLLNAAPLRSM